MGYTFSSRARPRACTRDVYVRQSVRDSLRSKRERYSAQSAASASSRLYRYNTLYIHIRAQSARVRKSSRSADQRCSVPVSGVGCVAYITLSIEREVLRAVVTHHGKVTAARYCHGRVYICGWHGPGTGRLFCSSSSSGFQGQH